MKNLKKLAIYVLGLICVAGVSSCDGADEEIDNLLYGRIFSPVDLKAGSIKETSAKLSWNASEGATSYTIQLFADDSLDVEGKTPDVTIKGVTSTEYTVSNLIYDTEYTAAVIAVNDTDESKTSKQTLVYFQTNPQQLFEDITEDDIADRSVTLKFPAGTEATTIVIGSITHTLTADEIAAGKVKIDGLTPETSYTAYMYNGTKERGSMKFTTIADLTGATLVHSTDDLKSLLQNATDGQVFALYGGTYTMSADEGTTGAGCADITKSITIKGIFPTNLPVIKGRFQIDGAGTGVTISQVVLDGSSNATTDQAFNFKTADVTYGSLDVQNTTLKGFSKGVFYVNVKSQIPSITFNNDIFADIECSGGDMFDCRTGYYGSLTITNSTIYNSCKDRAMVRFDDSSSSFPGLTTSVTISNCTIDGVESESANKGFLYIRFGGGNEPQSNSAVFTNNLVSNSTAAVFTAQSKTGLITFAGNAYYNSTKLQTLDLVGKTALQADESGKTLSAAPGYKDAANGDFTPSNDDVISGKYGDPRWLK